MKSDVKSILKELQIDIKKGNLTSESFAKYERKLSENIQNLIKFNSFFKFPLKYILSIISKTDFSLLQNSSSVISEIVQKTINEHKEEKSTLLLLKCIKFSNCSLSFSDCVNIIKCFTNSDLCVMLGSLYAEQITSVDIDYDYELQQKEIEIDNLKSKIKKLETENETLSFPPVHSIPPDFESDIFVAAEEGKLTSVQYLIEEKKIKPNITNNCNDTPLNIAAENGNLQIVRYLIEKHLCDKEIRGNVLFTPLHNACYGGFLPIVKYLIDKQNVDINARDVKGNTPLHIACEAGHIYIVQYLIETKGVNKEIQDKSGMTPLHIACISGHINVVEYLVDKQNVNIEAKTKQNQTPLHLASSFGKIHIVEYLVSRGAKKDAKDVDGKTPYDLACAFCS